MWVATIISERVVADGYNVVISTIGVNRTVHFVFKPTAIIRDATINYIERQITDDIAENIVIESDELLNYIEVDNGI